MYYNKMSVLSFFRKRLVKYNAIIFLFKIVYRENFFKNLLETIYFNFFEQKIFGFTKSFHSLNLRNLK